MRDIEIQQASFKNKDRWAVFYYGLLLAVLKHARSIMVVLFEGSVEAWKISIPQVHRDVFYGHVRVS